jgi:hypothetical protein
MLRTGTLLSALVAASAVPTTPTHRQLQAAKAPTKLATFDGALGTTHHWEDMNDPVMGGRSHSGFETASNIGTFSGQCAVVPFLHAPGFAKIETNDRRSNGRLLTPFPDVSKFFSGAFHLRVRTSTPEYTGFKVAFGAEGATRPTPSRHGGASFKADFTLSGTDWQVVKIPFNQFSIDWSEYTGECDTHDPTGEQHHCCSASHPEVCPTAAHLREITSLEVWAEGVEGTFALDIDWIGAGPGSSAH